MLAESGPPKLRPARQVQGVPSQVQNQTPSQPVQPFTHILFFFRAPGYLSHVFSAAKLSSPSNRPFPGALLQAGLPCCRRGVSGVCWVPSRAGDVVTRTCHLPVLPSDCPQVQCVHPYVAQQPDELTLELADILNILEKTEDGEGWGSGCISYSCRPHPQDSAPA